MKTLASVVALSLSIAALGCGKKEEPPPAPPVTVAAPATTQPAAVSVTSIVLGNAIGADKRVTTAAENFGVKDTIYASVETAGSGHARLRAHWTFVKGDKTAKVDETTIEAQMAGPAVNEFHVSKPSGWPKGDYKVEIFLNDSATPAVSRTFKVG